MQYIEYIKTVNCWAVIVDANILNAEYMYGKRFG